MPDLLFSTGLSVSPELPVCLRCRAARVPPRVPPRVIWCSPEWEMGVSRALRTAPLGSVHPHSRVLWDHSHCPLRPGERRPCIQVSSQEGQGDPEGLLAKILYFSIIYLFFYFLPFHKGQVSDDFRTWRSRNNWREEQSPPCSGRCSKSTKYREGEILGITWSEDPCAGSAPRACLVGAELARSCQQRGRMNVPGGQGLNQHSCWKSSSMWAWKMFLQQNRVFRAAAIPFTT